MAAARGGASVEHALTGPTVSLQRTPAWTCCRGCCWRGARPRWVRPCPRS